MLRVFTVLALLFTLCGCNAKVKNLVGVTTTGPDEYQVQKGKDLAVPPHYNLPEPLVQPVQEEKK